MSRLFKKYEQRIEHNTFSDDVFRKVQRGSSVTSVCIEEKELQDMDVTETDDFQRNILHHAVSKPKALKEILKVFKDVGTKEKCNNLWL